jgi:uncharacterized protein YlzI (FlbEa/FlbD family)
MAHEIDFVVGNGKEWYITISHIEAIRSFKDNSIILKRTAATP